MDVDDNINKEQAAAKVIRRRSDVVEGGIEEINGLSDLSSTSADESEDIQELKVGFTSLPNVQKGF
jgi:hypothetical protein